MRGYIPHTPRASGSGCGFNSVLVHSRKDSELVLEALTVLASTLIFFFFLTLCLGPFAPLAHGRASSVHTVYVAAFAMRCHLLPLRDVCTDTVRYIDCNGACMSVLGEDTTVHDTRSMLLFVHGVHGGFYFQFTLERPCLTSCK